MKFICKNEFFQNLGTKNEFFKVQRRKTKHMYSLGTKTIFWPSFYNSLFKSFLQNVFFFKYKEVSFIFFTLGPKMIGPALVPNGTNIYNMSLIIYGPRNIHEFHTIRDMYISHECRSHSIMGSTCCKYPIMYLNLKDIFLFFLDRRIL